MDSLNHDNQADIIDAFNSTSRYFDDLLNTDIFILKAIKIVHLNYSCIKPTPHIPKPPFLDLHLSIANGFVSSKIYDKRDDFDFDIFTVA